MHFATRLLLLSALWALVAGCRPLDIIEDTSSPLQAVFPAYLEFRDGHRLEIPMAAEPGASFIILVRHAEKAFGADNSLTPEGVRRALLLSNLLQNLPLDAVYSSPFKRNQETAQPVAQLQKLEVELYDPKKLSILARKLRRKHQGGKVLVVGHSDVTPDLVNRLVGKEVVERIPEDQYHDLFIVTINEDGESTLLRTRYEPEAEMME